MSYGYRGFKPMEHRSFITWFQHYFPSIYSVCGYLCGAGALELQIGHWLPLLHTGILVPKAKPEEPPPSLSHRTFFKTSSKRMSFFFFKWNHNMVQKPKRDMWHFFPFPTQQLSLPHASSQSSSWQEVRGGKSKKIPKCSKFAKPWYAPWLAVLILKKGSNPGTWKMK